MIVRLNHRSKNKFWTKNQLRVARVSARRYQTRRAFSNAIFSRTGWPIFEFLFLKRYYSSRETIFVWTKLSYSVYFGFLPWLNFNLIINVIIVKKFRRKMIFFILDTFSSITQALKWGHVQGNPDEWSSYICPNQSCI